MKNDRLNIRLMKMSDLPQVIQIEQEVFTDPWQEDMFYQEIIMKSSFVLEDTIDSKILGYICGYGVLDEYSLMNIAVREKYRRKGYGSIMLGFLIAKCIAKRVKTIFLEVRESNISAINLYYKAGFYYMGKRKEYYNQPVEDALVLKLDL